MSRTFIGFLLGCCTGAMGLAGWNYAPGFIAQAIGQHQLSTGSVMPGAAELGALSDRFETVAKRVLPAVVSIEASKVAGAAGNQRKVEDSGSGIMIAADNNRGVLVVTNYHVIASARPEQININLPDGRLIRPSQVLSDPETDIALLKIETSGSLSTATLGDSDKVRVGQWVLALGSPFGLSQTVTHGIVSATGRGQVSLGNTIRIKDFVQTDAAINPGSSGGPLVNLNGEVIGINTAIASQSGSNSGVSFSIPVNLVRRVARQLQDRGSVSHGYVGVQLASAFEPADAMRLGLDRAHGARIEAVVAQSPAATAGLRANDVVLQLDTVSVRNDTHLINLISMLPAGQRVRLNIWRDRQVVPVEVIVGDWNVAKSRFRPEANP